MPYNSNRGERSNRYKNNGRDRDAKNEKGFKATREFKAKNNEGEARGKARKFEEKSFSSHFENKSNDKREYKQGDKREYKQGDRKEFKHSDKREYKQGDKREFKHSDKREYKQGDKREFKHSDKREYKQGDKREFKHSDKRGFKNREHKFNETVDRADSFEREDAVDRIEGRNAVLEALNAGRTINKILVSTDDRHSSLGKIIAQARENGIVVQQLETKKLDELSTTRSHQGVIAFVAVKDYVEIEDILQIAKEKEQPPFIILLDGVTDVNNFGSILRTANITGAHGVIIPKRRSVTLNSTVAKVAAGAVEYVPVARVSNIVNAIEKLKQNGIWVVGTDMEGDTVFYEADIKGAIALVIGSEGEGLSRLVKEECDFVVKIPMKGEITSLNAGVAAGLVMYEVAKQRGF